MTHRFVAIDVGRGDAFFLQRGDFSVLVDGGWASGFPTRFRNAVRTDFVKLLVCTHNDSDHSRGILQLLTKSRCANEIWLPATWLEVVDRISAAERNELESLLDDSPPSELPEQVARSDEDVTDAESVEATLADSSEWESLHGWAPWSTTYALNFALRASISRNRAPTRWLKAAANILAIAHAAIQRQLRIVWFDPELAPNTPPRTPISVINATSVTSSGRSRLDLKQVIALTMVNRLSLVLFSPGDHVAPGVLFCADSGFKNLGSPPTEANMIVTAPHHGSADAENVRVYGLLASVGAASDPSSWIWVRSDKDHPKRPCQEYLALAHRGCTRCRGRSLQQNPQDVVFWGEGGRWRTAARRCNCVP